MLFNSAEFLLVFLPLTLLGYYQLMRRHCVQTAKTWLVLASLFFYAWWNPAYLPLILVSLGVNFAIGSRLARNPEKHTAGLLLAAGVIFNLALLGYYKYANFALATLASATGWPPPVAAVTLPLAISFFSFTQIAYLVDSRRGETREYDLLNYALFVTFFPHLIAGPIVHHREIMPQFARPRNWLLRHRHVLPGLMLLSAGLAKKVLIADTLAPWAAAGFDQPGALGLCDAWLASFAYTLQLYFDFSGYTDMTLGASLMFNIRLPINFDSPYRATSIRDFWRRWHITLSRFLRDYLYLPLGGNRRGPLRTGVNLLATFVLGGLWHGASWLFVFWGLLHGVAVVIHRLWRHLGLRLPAAAGWLLTLAFVNLAWVFFRAPTFDAAIRVLDGLAGNNGIGFDTWATRLAAPTWAPWFLAAAVLLALQPRNSMASWFGAAPRIGAWQAVAGGLLAGTSLLAILASRYTEFIYFNF
jgi:D-alanyl-lipoteichoic acid acyltransferase DltB (MBOAT superfamily)